ncbi:MAG: phosphoribosyltransferase [Planctomycetes bacterium GWF2_41_51]|nr:MAG: phosphoribosyltransferase [Planctomycetes bacterium GWF2_41_51]HBG27183.1 phosphoribosyltransferase [Phycisphaerales bacterium]
MFEDRKDAGQKLGKALEYYRHCDGVVLAIPRGGVEVGFYVAQQLSLPLSIVIVRKLPFPENPEAGFGAIAEDESAYFVNKVYDWMPFEKIQRVIDHQKEEVKRRVNVLRHDTPLPHITGKTVLLIDDGIAMGSTMQAAVMLCRNQKAKKIVIAAPVAGMETAMEMARIADEVVILEKPSDFRAVADYYQNWYDVSDEEVIEIMQKQNLVKGKKHG